MLTVRVIVFAAGATEDIKFFAARRAVFFKVYYLNDARFVSAGRISLYDLAADKTNIRYDNAVLASFRSFGELDESHNALVGFFHVHVVIRLQNVAVIGYRINRSIRRLTVLLIVYVNHFLFYGKSATVATENFVLVAQAVFTAVIGIAREVKIGKLFFAASTAETLK